MSGSVTRRRLFGAVGAVLGVGLAAGVTFEFGLWRRPWPNSPYDDLLEQLPLDEGAVRLGRAVRQAVPTLDDQATAAELRARLKTRPLSELAQQDAQHGQLITVSGWLLPASVAELCALAASTAKG